MQKLYFPILDITMLSLVLYLSLVTFIFANTCPFKSSCVCKNWNYEVRISKLEEIVKELNKNLQEMKNSNRQAKAEMKATQTMVKGCLSCENSSWSLKRVELLFPQLQRLSLHQQSPTYVEKLPTPLPSNTKAVIISIFCNFWNSGGHAYLNIDIQQKGNDDGGKAKLKNTHYKVYANTFYYEILLPWDSNISDQIVFKVISSFLTGGSSNWYSINLVGYITA